MVVKTDKITDYNKFVCKSKDSSYTRGIFNFCVAWANKIEEKMAKGAVLADIADDSEMECYKEDPSLDVTGHMYSCAISILSSCWEHGDELRKWHNDKYHYQGDGVVSTSIISAG